MPDTPPENAAVIPHPWIGEAGQWRCSRCSAVCDHDEPCGRHGSCAPLPDSMTPAALCTWRDQGRVCRENREWHEGTDHPFTEPTSAAGIPYEGTECTAKEAIEAVSAVRASAARLTAPQLLALRVAHDAGRAVKTWRNASRAEPTPYINFRAADSLDRLGLLRLGLSDGRYGHYEVTCTAAGCAVLAEVLDA